MLTIITGTQVFRECLQSVRGRTCVFPVYSDTLTSLLLEISKSLYFQTFVIYFPPWKQLRFAQN